MLHQVSGDSSYVFVLIEVQCFLSQALMASLLVKNNFRVIVIFKYLFGLVFWCTGGASVHCSSFCYSIEHASTVLSFL